MQTQILAYTADGTKVVGWLHRALGQPKTLVVLIHGHNSDGTRGRFIELAKWLDHHGVDCLRFSITRKEISAGVWEVPTLTEEVNQSRAIVQKVRGLYKTVIVAGHSQGAVIAVQLSLDTLADAVVSMMGLVDTASNQHDKLRSVGVDLPELKKGEHADVQIDESKTMRYTAAFFEDVVQWDVPTMLTKLHAPILFVLAEHDKSIIPSEVMLGYNAANEPKVLFKVDDGHRFSNATSGVIAHKMLEWMKHEKLL